MDFGARNYNAQIGRWGNLDPLADKYYNYSPYTYVANNPTIYIDPTGKEIIIFGANLVNYSTVEKRKASTGMQIDPLPILPKSVGELGLTTFLGGSNSSESLSYSLNKKTGKYDVTANIRIEINEGLNTNERLDRINPGLRGEAEDHERAHGEQYSEGIKSTITIGSMFQAKDSKGNITGSRFSGTIDNVLDQAYAMYDKVRKDSPNSVKGISKKQYLDNIFIISKNEILKKINVLATETDANVRAFKKRDGNMPYTQGSKNIRL